MILGVELVKLSNKMEGKLLDCLRAGRAIGAHSPEQRRVGEVTAI